MPRAELGVMTATLPYTVELAPRVIREALTDHSGDCL